MKEVREIQIQLMEWDLLKELIRSAFRIRGDKMGYMDMGRESVIPHTDSGHEIQPEKGQVCKVILVQRLIFQMGMDAPDTAKTSLPQAEIREVRDHDLLLIPHDDMVDNPLAVNDHADLTVYL